MTTSLVATEPHAVDSPRPQARSRTSRLTFRIVFGLLTVQFALLGVSYLADPAGAVRTLSKWNVHLGGVPLAPPDVPPWRYATAVGMTTLALMCLMALIDLRRNHPVVIPAAFFKAYNAVLWFHYASRYLPVFYLAGAIDVVEAVVMLMVAQSAYRALTEKEWAR